MQHRASKINKCTLHACHVCRSSFFVGHNIGKFFSFFFSCIINKFFFLLYHQQKKFYLTTGGKKKEALGDAITGLWYCPACPDEPQLEPISLTGQIAFTCNGVHAACTVGYSGSFLLLLRVLLTHPNRCAGGLLFFL